MDRVSLLIGVENSDLDPVSIDAERASAALNILGGFRDRLTTAAQSVVTLGSKYEEVQRQVQEADQEAKAYLVELGVCPVCGVNTFPVTEGVL